MAQTCTCSVAGEDHNDPAIAHSHRVMLFSEEDVSDIAPKVDVRDASPRTASPCRLARMEERRFIAACPAMAFSSGLELRFREE